MLKIVKNETNIERFKGEKYLLYGEPQGIGPMYAKISFKSLLGYIIGSIKFK